MITFYLNSDARRIFTAAERRALSVVCGNICLQRWDGMRKPKLNPYQELSNAIIVMAAKDYRHALRIQRRNPDSQAARIKIDEIERFFRSDWYRLLTNVDGEMLIKKLREER